MWKFFDGFWEIFNVWKDEKWEAPIHKAERTKFQRIEFWILEKSTMGWVFITILLRITDSLFIVKDIIKIMLQRKFMSHRYKYPMTQHHNLTSAILRKSNILNNLTHFFCLSVLKWSSTSLLHYSLIYDIEESFYPICFNSVLLRVF